jgi:hypothetical protein
MQNTTALRLKLTPTIPSLMGKVVGGLEPRVKAIVSSRTFILLWRDY